MRWEICNSCRSCRLCCSCPVEVKPELPTREGFAPFKVPTPEEVEKKLKATMKQYPKLTKSEALLLNIYRGTKEVSMLVSNSDGGGLLARYIRSLAHKGVKY